MADLGELMNINQGLLNAIQVSTPDLEKLISVARNAGALGAKLTGGGGGGAMIALCGTTSDNCSAAVREALERSGCEALAFEIGGGQ